MTTKILLDEGWQFKQATSLNSGTASSFLPVSQFPTIAHLDLLHHKLIPDPYIDDHELKCLWVNDADWTYRNEKVGPVTLKPEERATLVFEGLDTVVDVFLDGKPILFSKNMHVSHRVDVTELLRDRKEASTLELKFRNAPHYSRQEKARIGYKGNETDVHFGGNERLFLRKAQYSWGWDWGPAINACGPWKPVYIETYVSRLDDFIVRQEMAADLKTANVTIKGNVENAQSDQEVKLELLGPDGTKVQDLKVYPTSDGLFNGRFDVENPKVWFPFTYGEQPLYTVKASLSGTSDVRSVSIGLRRLRILQHPLKNAPGTSFLFEINNIRAFCGGSCWIPGDFMLPRMTSDRYEDWLTLAKSGNQSMIRVWGGGIVEEDAFYNICDREGILVWQDFLFACGNYPASKDFCENVKHEAEQQVKRVGHHASLAIWAGNNEDYMLANRWNWEWDVDDENGPWDHTDFPARLIYERILPDVISRLGGDVPYWRSSPYGGRTANDLTIGDTYIWDVWHGKMSPYQDYKLYTSRFISEFGFESCASLRTMHKAITNPKERHAQSLTFDIHDKGPGHQRRYPMYMGENYRFRMNPLRDFIYCTQFLQAEAMSYAYNCWRREFRGPGEENCSGVLVWQLNDIWPGVSWALVDVDRHLKPAFFITKRALAKVVVGMERTVTQQPPYIVTGYAAIKGALDIWAVNGHLEELKATLKLSAFDIESGKPVTLPASVKTERQVTLKPNQTNELISLPHVPHHESTVIVAYLDDPSTGARLARWVSWPEPLKYVHFSPELKVTCKVVEGGEKVVLSANAPVKGVVLQVPVEEGGDDAVFEDNFVDLVPGEEIEIKVSGLKGRKLQTRFLCDWELEKDFEL